MPSDQNQPDRPVVKTTWRTVQIRLGGLTSKTRRRALPPVFLASTWHDPAETGQTRMKAQRLDQCSVGTKSNRLFGQVRVEGLDSSSRGRIPPGARLYGVGGAMNQLGWC